MAARMAGHKHHPHHHHNSSADVSTSAAAAEGSTPGQPSRTAAHPSFPGHKFTSTPSSPPGSPAASPAASSAAAEDPPQPSPAAAAAEAHRRASIFMQALMSAASFDQHNLQGLQLVSSSPGHTAFTLSVTPQLQNRYGTLHGGAIATLVDVAGSLALITQSDRSGVSLAINTLYLNPMPGGEVVWIDAAVIKLGRDVATIEVQLRRQSTGQLVATGTHTKKLVTASDMSALFDSGLKPQQLQQQQQQQARPHSRL